MRRLLLLAAACAPTAVACNAVFGIDPFVTYDGGAAGGTSSSSSSSSSAGGGMGTGGDGGVESCDGGFDLEGCACEMPGATQACYHGVPGAMSACKSAGTQVCADDGTASHWAECLGGSFPTDEICFDVEDNDCDGVVDQACPCSESLDSCNAMAVGLDAGSFDPQQYNFFTYPATPHVDETFSIVIVTQQSVNSPALGVQPIGCFGHTNKRCVSPGTNCPGWNILRWEATLSTPGSHSITLYIDDPPNPPDGPCQMGKDVETTTIELLP